MNIQELRINDDTARGESFTHFARLIREKNLDAGVLIGIAFGGQAEAILEQPSVSELVGVDAYEPAVDKNLAVNVGELAPGQFENLFWYVMGRLSRFGARYNHLRGSSPQASQVLKNVELDFVLLDGERLQAALFHDLSLWFPKLRNGGVIGGHGYDAAASPGVKSAVDGFLASRGLTVHVEPGNVWWVEKHV